MNRLIRALALACIAVAPAMASGPQSPPVRRGYTIPLLDLADQGHRQVVVDREPGQYLGHPTTVLLEDGRTILAAYPKGHGRGAIALKRSTDGGLTWSDRLPVPENWATSQETPTIHRVVDPQGKRRLVLFSGLYPIRMASSEDDGRTWTPLEPIGDLGGIVAMASIERLGDGSSMALFHDDGRFLHGEGKKSKFRVYKTFSSDGGRTWGKPEAIAEHPDADLCEPGLVRSPDGRQLAVLLRENRRKLNSFVITSDDEGKTWTAPRELPGSLTGDRHVGKYAPDGRLFVSFRDTTHESPTRGDWVGWVGTYEDIVTGREGQYRVRLMDNTKQIDCAYPGVEVLPDGTCVATTYGHWAEGEPPYIVSVRFTLAELDELAKARTKAAPRGEAGRAARPTDDPVARYGLAWTGEIRWADALDIQDVPGETPDGRLEAAQEALASRGGGVVYFPPGTYRFAGDIRLRDGVVLRGADPEGVTDARTDGYDPPSKLEFPRYVPRPEGVGTPIATAFKGIVLADPERASRCGVVNLSINRGHIDLGEGTDHRKGRGRLVYGCALRNAAVANPAIPDVGAGQHPWQRYTHGHVAAVNVVASENILVANNRLPRSGDDDFAMPGYVLKGRKGEPVEYEVTFDYDNRPGLTVNTYCLGGPGAEPPDGTPETHPFAFGKGVVIRDNFVYCTGRSAIKFCGDGAYCGGNVVRFEPDVWRPTHTGLHVSSGSSTNDNRAVQMRGWRWTVEGNDYEVYKNWAADRKYRINDGEGLMHEDHCNSTVLGSRLIGNRGNSYLSIYHTGGIDGLLVEGNEIRTPGGIPAIYVVADRHRRGNYPCRNVRIVGNVTSGGGIRLQGDPAAGNLIGGNRHEGPGGEIVNRAGATVEGNMGYERP